MNYKPPPEISMHPLAVQGAQVLDNSGFLSTHKEKQFLNIPILRKNN